MKKIKNPKPKPEVISEPKESLEPPKINPKIATKQNLLQKKHNKHNEDLKEEGKTLEEDEKVYNVRDEEGILVVEIEYNHLPKPPEPSIPQKKEEVPKPEPEKKPEKEDPPHIQHHEKHLKKKVEKRAHPETTVVKLPGVLAIPPVIQVEPIIVPISDVERRKVMTK